MTPCDENRIAWVSRYVLPHEASLREWLRRAFPAIDVDDIVQETFCRLAAAPSVAHVLNPKSYLFRTARNLVLEQVRRARVVRIDAVGGLADIEEALGADMVSPERVVSGRRELDRVEALIAALPERCRQIFLLRKIEAVPQREIARRMGVTETIVENEIARGLRSILRAMAAGVDDDDLPILQRKQQNKHARNQRSA